MLILADWRLPKSAFKILSQFGEALPFKTENITYKAISGHPDIFFTKIGANSVVVAPNTPAFYLKKLEEHKINYTLGELKVGKVYPETAHYNAVVTENYLVHNSKITDPILLETCREKRVISVKQGYSRCNLIPLTESLFLCSDQGIFKTAVKHKIEAYYIDPKDITLSGFKNGFIGGALGIYDHKLFVSGALSYLSEGELIEKLANRNELEVIELTDTPLFDGGSILFLGEEK